VLLLSNNTDASCARNVYHLSPQDGHNMSHSLRFLAPREQEQRTTMNKNIPRSILQILFVCVSSMTMHPNPLTGIASTQMYGECLSIVHIRSQSKNRRRFCLVPEWLHSGRTVGVSWETSWTLCGVETKDEKDTNQAPQQQTKPTTYLVCRRNAKQDSFRTAGQARVGRCCVWFATTSQRHTGTLQHFRTNSSYTCWVHITCCMYHKWGCLALGVGEESRAAPRQVSRPCTGATVLHDTPRDLSSCCVLLTWRSLCLRVVADMISMVLDHFAKRDCVVWPKHTHERRRRVPGCVVRAEKRPPLSGEISIHYRVLSSRPFVVYTLVDGCTNIGKAHGQLRDRQHPRSVKSAKYCKEYLLVCM